MVKTFWVSFNPYIFLEHLHLLSFQEDMCILISDTVVADIIIKLPHTTSEKDIV